MTSGVHLLAYADRLAGDLPGMRRLLIDGPLAAFSGVHLLPFFVPYDGPDAGFDPVDHASVDPRLGAWSDIRALADAGLEVTADLIVNHVSARSAEYIDWLANGAQSPWDGMFLTYDAVFPDGAHESEITAVYRPRVGLPFTPYQMVDGTRRLVWTTFLPDQIDLDLGHPTARAYLRRVLEALAVAGVGVVRLDAIGYAIKTPGTDCFLTPDTLTFVGEITEVAHGLGLRVLVELHGHYTQQQAIAPLVDYVYDFALPPLLLHALGTGDAARIAQWLRIRPSNAITVLDTHDGIGVIDVGPAGQRPGLIDDHEMAAIVARAADATAGESTAASRTPAWMKLPHQINSTFLSTLAEPASYLLARAVQLFVPGLPQIYYVGLLGGRNDMELFARTGEGRDVNRHHYGAVELAAALGSELARAQLALVRLRTDHPAFRGGFTASVPQPHRLVLDWTAGAHRAQLTADFQPDAPAFRIDVTDPAGGRRKASTVAEVAGL